MIKCLFIAFGMLCIISLLFTVSCLIRSGAQKEYPDNESSIFVAGRRIGCNLARNEPKIAELLEQYAKKLSIGTKHPQVALDRFLAILSQRAWTPELRSDIDTLNRIFGTPIEEENRLYLAEMIGREFLNGIELCKKRGDSNA